MPAARTNRRASLFAMALLASVLVHVLVGGRLYRSAIEIAAPPHKVDQRVSVVPIPVPVSPSTEAPDDASAEATDHTGDKTGDKTDDKTDDKTRDDARRPRPAPRAQPPPTAGRTALTTNPPPVPTPSQEVVNKPAPPPAPAGPRQRINDEPATAARPSLAPTVDLRRRADDGDMGKIVLGRRLPLQPSIGQLEGALTQEDRVAKILQGAMRRPWVGTASPEAAEELGPLVRRLDAAWDTLANDRLRGSQLSGVTAFLRKMGEGSTAWKQYYGDFLSRQTDGNLLDQLARGPGREDRLKVGEHLELVVELHHDDRGDVTSVDIVASSGDVAFDEDVRRSFLDITSTHRPRGNNVRTSRIRLVADSRVSVPKCGAVQGPPGASGPSNRAGRDSGFACGFDFGDEGVEVPFSTQVSGSAHLEAAEMR